MPRTRLLALLAIAMVAGLVATGCKGPMDLTPKVGIASTTWILNLQPATYTIWAGQNESAGVVTVWFDDANLYIEYDLTMGNWWLEETHAHAALSLDGIPHSKGGPIPGKFDSSSTFEPRVQTKTYKFPIQLDEWVEGTELYIATHCVVVQETNGKYKNRQTGWAGPYDYPGKNWAKYIKYRRFIKDVKLPTYTIRAKVDEDPDPAARTSTFIVSLSGIETGDETEELKNSPPTYLGWCAEHDKGILVGREYDTKLQSSEHPNLPSCPHIRTDRWDNVNYLLNNKRGATARDIQVAIWWLLTPDDATLITGPDPAPLVGNAKVMHDEAMLYGEGWHPVPGARQMLAVILDIQGMIRRGSPVKVGFDIQPVFIEVDP